MHGLGRVNRVRQGKTMGRTGTARCGWHITESGQVLRSAAGGLTGVEGRLSLLGPDDPNTLGWLASLAGARFVAHALLLDS